MAAALWYVMQRGSRLGPFPAETLQRMVDYGEVSPDDLVWCDGMADWVKARTVIKPSDYRPPESRRRERYDDRDDRYDDRRDDRYDDRRGGRYDDREPSTDSYGHALRRAWIGSDHLTHVSRQPIATVLPVRAWRDAAENQDDYSEQHCCADCITPNRTFSTAIAVRLLVLTVRGPVPDDDFVSPPPRHCRRG